MLGHLHSQLGHGLRAVKLRKTIKPVLKTGLSGEEGFENPA
jgi:hypothetical protein